MEDDKAFGYFSIWVSVCVAAFLVFVLAEQFLNGAYTTGAVMSLFIAPTLILGARTVYQVIWLAMYPHTNGDDDE